MTRAGVAAAGRAASAAGRTTAALAASWTAPGLAVIGRAALGQGRAGDKQSQGGDDEQTTIHAQAPTAARTQAFGRAFKLERCKA